MLLFPLPHLLLHFRLTLSSPFQVATAPAGTQAATMDIEAAYRTVPVWPPHKRFLVVGFEGQFWIDHVFPFGLTTAGGVQGNIADATVDILHELDISPIKKWVDDHSIFRFPVGGGYLCPDGSLSPYLYLFGLADIYTKSQPLGIPWHPKKCTDFALLFIYLGFLWDLSARSVALPEPKREKYLAKLKSIILDLQSGKPLSHKAALSINGTLSHITFVIPHGRAYLANLSRFIAQYHNNFISRIPPPSVKNDLLWWLNVLSSPPPPRPLTPRGPPRDLDIWVDASTDWGIGLVWGNKWDAWTIVEGWKGHGRDIGWLEAVAVELAVMSLFLSGWSNCSIIINSDNQGVIGAFKCGRSRNFHVNLCIRRVEAIAMASNTLHVLAYTASLANKADLVSHGETGPAICRLPSFQLPEELVLQ